MKKAESKVARIENRYIKDTATMKKTRSRRRVALFRRLAFMAIIFAVVGGLLTITYTKQVLTLKEKKAKQVQVDKKMVAMKDEEDALNDQIKKLHNDEYIAKLARSEYYLSKDGEIIFNIPEENSKQKE
ncbi:septum formation initiator family protein [Listeria sp. FSL L7-0233]|uniref:Septum formation initiator family protein n=1 Tax=Listeria cossartiae subsp. cayugensis TaxID=2713505 RepID=A0A7X1DCH6_9LIST|nr:MULTISPECIES: septum formation initiator family protein [Listeria]MBC1544151.1 septum formation initiator family protein [Listeria cossartiae subsp. cossartiae]MBC1547025.1 septum formation initiator family protein [Listeria cossartiae subsp. cossartiae]MBC1549324.1 septum formation initiator family protein [Listeria cossartiae subsp. cossartiae]MBC1568726.1 septum formation initiator family protein [Listeria cossartiae subsp. cossartiae]MBC1571860.1 septum formation initiator family protei